MLQSRINNNNCDWHFELLEIFGLEKSGCSLSKTNVKQRLGLKTTGACEASGWWATDGRRDSEKVGLDKIRLLVTAKVIQNIGYQFRPGLVRQNKEEDKKTWIRRLWVQNSPLVIFFPLNLKPAFQPQSKFK